MSNNPNCEKNCDITSCLLRGLNIGLELLQRLKSGDLDEVRKARFENEWLNKIECLDATHTKVNKLTIEEADRLIKHLKVYAEGGNRAACPEAQNEVLSCLQKNANDPIACSCEVERFMACVDDALRYQGRISFGIHDDRKLTYTQKFRQLSTSRRANDTTLENDSTKNLLKKSTVENMDGNPQQGVGVKSDEDCGFDRQR